MSIEDRVRAATRARTALVRNTGPLELPAEPAEAAGPARRSLRSRRWLHWVLPPRPRRWPRPW